MPFHEIYRKQVELLLRVLPIVAEESCFALKGGTAINLFVRDLPRLSVDIDLTYLPIADRKSSLDEIESALMRIKENITASSSNLKISESHPSTQDTTTRLIIRASSGEQVKIETTPVMRGVIFPATRRSVTTQVEKQFGFAETNVVSHADLYAGKIVATLDRQHPRDLFDVSLLLEEEGISTELRSALIVYMICHKRSPDSLLRGPLRDLSHDYENNFRGMTTIGVSLEELNRTYTTLVDDLIKNMPDNHKEFLVTFYLGVPDWDLLELPDVQDLPAVRWRQRNLEAAGNETLQSISNNIRGLLGMSLS